MDPSLLTIFELDRPDDSWIDRIRRAEAPLPLGRLGDYELLAEINRGGQGLVYRARQPGTRREVALKRLLAGTFATPEMRQRFEREIETAATLNHANIVTVYGSDVVDGQPLLTMQWIDGVPVTEWASAQGTDQRSIRENVQMFALICDAVQHAHQRGVIHRDLKPSNILVDAADQPHVLDFGLAKLAGDSAQSTASSSARFMGTLAYAAPEQLLGDSRQIDVRTDVYSLGVVFYEMLTGRRPVDVGHNLPAALRAIEQSEPRRPADLRPEIDGELQAIVLKTLQKDKAQRYQSVSALADDLQRYLAGETVLAHPPSATYQLGKLLRRHKWPVALGSVVLGLVLAFGIAATILWRGAVNAGEREHAARTDEARARQVAEQISDFLQGMLASVDPADVGREVTVREVLDRAAQDVEAELAEFPEVNAAVQHTIGITYQSLGVYGAAEMHLRQALAIRMQRHGELHAASADTISALGRVRQDQGAYEEAELLLRQALAIRQQLWAPPHPQVADALHNLGCLLGVTGDYDEAEAALRGALQMRQALLGAQDPDVAATMTRLAALLTDRGDHAAADTWYRQALEILRAAYAEDHPALHDCAQTYGEFLSARADFQAAETLLTEALDMSRRLWGPAHPQVAKNLDGLATLRQATADYAAAEAYFREALEINRTVFGDAHPAVASSMNNLAALLRVTGDLDEAESLFRQSLEQGRQFLSNDHPDIVTRRNNLAAVLYSKGDYAAAEPLFLEALAVNRQLWGAAHPHIDVSLNNLGKLYFAMADYAASERYLRESAEMCRALFGDDHPTLGTRLHNLANTLAAAGKQQDAAAAYREAIAIRRSALGDDHRHVAQSLLSLGKLLMALDDHAGAEPLLAESVRIREQALPAGHWHIAYTRSVWGECLAELGHYQRAEAALLESHAAMQEKLGSDHRRTAEVRARLDRLYELWGKGRGM